MAYLGLAVIRYYSDFETTSSHIITSPEDYYQIALKSDEGTNIISYKRAKYRNFSPRVKMYPDKAVVKLYEYDNFDGIRPIYVVIDRSNPHDIGRVGHYERNENYEKDYFYQF